MFFSIKIIIAIVKLFGLVLKYNFVGWTTVGLVSITLTQNSGS